MSLVSKIPAPEATEVSLYEFDSGWKYVVGNSSNQILETFTATEDCFVTVFVQSTLSTAPQAGWLLMRYPYNNTIATKDYWRRTNYPSSNAVSSTSTLTQGEMYYSDTTTNSYSSTSINILDPYRESGMPIYSGETFSFEVTSSLTSNSAIKYKVLAKKMTNTDLSNIGRYHAS